MKSLLPAAALFLFLPIAAAAEDRASELGLVNIWTSSVMTTAICGCPYSTDWDGSNRQARIDECEFAPDKEELTGYEIDFMPVISGGLTARGFTPPEPLRGIPKKNDIFEDPAIYIPVLNDVASLIGNRRYGEARGGTAVMGACPLLVDYRTGIAEPTGEAKGIIGRIHLYAMDAWKIPLTQAEISLFQKWSDAAPAGEEEKRRARNISRMTGIENPVFRE